ncbi:MAG: ATP-binding protein [Candidatus Thorarchaeota archaeon]
MPFRLLRVDDTKLTLHSKQERSWFWIRISWISGISLAGIYLLLVYIFPLLGLMIQPHIPFKMFLELMICLVPLLTGFLVTLKKIQFQKPVISVDNNVLLVQLDNYVIGTCCLDIISVSGSVFLDDEGKPKYNESMLLAMRAGMSKTVSMAFEAGVFENEPYLRIFITATGQTAKQITEILRREATRTEAILLASLRNVELNLIENEHLQEVALSHYSGLLDFEKFTSNKEEESSVLMMLRGTPRSSPSLEASQIGTFISTALRQGYSTSMTCVFSTAKPGKEKRKLEGQWKTIQAKERRKEESLQEHAAKKRLLTRYEEIQDEIGWFDTTVYFIVKSTSNRKIDADLDGVKGFVYSIWGGNDSIKLVTKKIQTRTAYRLLTRRHLKRQRMHIARLASFVNTPIQQLPVITPIQAPSFSVPTKELVDNDLVIAETVFGGRRLSKVGLKVDWLREHVAVLGATGTGKTTLVKHLMTQLSENTSVPWWIFDVKGSEYHSLVRYGKSEVLVLKPGVDDSFTLDLIDPEMKGNENCAYSTFIILKELLNERGDSSELSPAMEKLLRESVVEVVKSLGDQNSVQALSGKISELANKDRIGNMTRDALLNRLEILTREPLGSILKGGPDAVRISDLLDRRVILDLSYIARKGGMDAARLFYNLVAKRIFDSSMKRGISDGLHHVVVLEEASNLVPESYTRHSAADVTTGESMVMLQRATGQGVIVVSTRPNISSNILANTSTKIAFRLPYDSQVGGRFMSLSEEQERYLRILKRGRALMSIPHTETFEIATKPFVDSSDDESLTVVTPITQTGGTISEKVTLEVALEDDVKTDTSESIHTTEAQTIVFNRIDRLGNHIVAFLAAEGWATEEEIRNLLSTLDPSNLDDDISEVIRNLVSLGTVERESLALVPGGFVFTLPGSSLDAVRRVIIDYIYEKLGLEYDGILSDSPDFPDIILEDKAVVIIPEHLRASSMGVILDRIRNKMIKLQNSVRELFVVVRGSVAAAKLRELMDSSEEFNEVSVVSAFPRSLDSVIENLSGTTDSSADRTVQSQLEESTESADKTDLIEAIHEVGSAPNRAIQIRLWFGLIQDLVDISNGQVKWEDLLEFIETTALQSLKGRSAPLNIEEGKRALTELLADEVLIAIRVEGDSQFVELENGLWLVNSSVLQDLKEKAVNAIETALKKRSDMIYRDHGYYDLCVGGTSYVIFPNQQQLNTLLHLHSDVACRTCKSTNVVCVLTASEYLEESVTTPSNLIIRTMNDKVSTLLI